MGIRLLADIIGKESDFKAGGAIGGVFFFVFYAFASSFGQAGGSKKQGNLLH